MVSRCFSFVECKYKLVQSSSTPGLSVLHLLRQCCRLTSPTKGCGDTMFVLSMVSLWSPPHHWLLFAYFHTPPLAHFLISSCCAKVSPQFQYFILCFLLVCQMWYFFNFSFFLNFRYVCPSCNIMLWYSVLYRAVVEGRAGQGYSR